MVTQAMPTSCDIQYRSHALAICQIWPPLRVGSSFQRDAEFPESDGFSVSTCRIVRPNCEFRELFDLVRSQIGFSILSGASSRTLSSLFRTDGLLHVSETGAGHAQFRRAVERHSDFVHPCAASRSHARWYTARSGTRRLRTAQRPRRSIGQPLRVTARLHADRRASTTFGNAHGTTRERRMRCYNHRYCIDVQQPFRPPARLAWLERVAGLPSPTRSLFVPAHSAVGKEVS